MTRTERESSRRNNISIFKNKKKHVKFRKQTTPFATHPQNKYQWTRNKFFYWAQDQPIG